MTARATRAAGVVLVVVATTLAGIGWLDLMRRWGLLHGTRPLLPEALPLQRLAGNGAQPLPRVILAWLPAVLFAGGVLRMLGLRSRPLRGAVAFAGCALLLLALGGLADAVSESDPLLSHMGAQPGRVVIWLAAALAGVAATAPARRSAP
jgi:hypothetical protein